MKVRNKFPSENKRRQLFIGMTALKHQVWFSIKRASALVLQSDYNRPEGAGC
jgi:hypothetical protein